MNKDASIKRVPLLLPGLAAIIGCLLLSVGAVLVVTGPPDVVDTPPSSGAKNVVLIVLDALRADRVGASRNGVPLTPFLDSLAEEAVVFSNAITPCTWTRPAMASAFTSLHLDTHQVYFGKGQDDDGKQVSDVLHEELPTVAKMLKAAGYATIGVQANGNLSPEFGFHHGFDVYETHHDMKGGAVGDLAMAHLEGRTAPFFLYAHYMDTHLPFEPPERYEAMMGFPPEGIEAEELAVARDFLGYFYDHLHYLRGRKESRDFAPLSDAGKEAVLALYDGEVRYSDDEVRRLIEFVRSRWPNTVFIITADHGEHFWDHEYLGHGLTLYDCELRVPLLLTSPDLKPAVVEQPVSLVDLPPTLAGLLGLPGQEQWQGRDMLDIENPPSAVFSQTRTISPAWNIHLEAVIYEGMKLIVDRVEGGEELYDWHADPMERSDLRTERPEQAEVLRAALESHRQSNLQARRTLREQTALDPEIVEQMRRLGYME